MTTEEAIAVYNEMADKYNSVMDLYDTCECPYIETRPRMPLYAPDSTKKHSDLITVYHDHYLEPDGVKLINLIDSASQTLEGLSLKKHGPRDAYYWNGYVQLYTDTYIDPETGMSTDSTNDLAIDCVRNSCATVDDLDPVPADPNLLEFKVYPILNTTNEDNIDSAVDDAMTVFNEVAELPKICSTDQDAYGISLELEYTQEEYSTAYSKGSYETKLKAIFSALVNYIATDYNNWINGNASTLSRDISNLMAAYTNASTYESLKIGSTGDYTVASRWQPNIPAGASGSYSGSYYCKPAIQYDMGIDGSNYYCTKAYLGPITFRAVRYNNPYTNADMHEEGFSYEYAVGEVKFTPVTVPYTEVRDPLITAKSAKTYNSLSHLTSLTTSHYDITINPCDAVIQSPGEIDELFTFPDISFEYYLNLYDPVTQTSYACHVYKGTTYYHHTLNFTPVCEQLTVNTATYLTPHQEESEE